MWGNALLFPTEREKLNALSSALKTSQVINFSVVLSKKKKGKKPKPNHHHSPMYYQGVFQI